jgi:hypothetical protein
MMAPHLLSLPAEARNTIFKLVLSDSGGVIYRENHQGAWRLCLPFITQEDVNIAQEEKIAKEVRRRARGVFSKDLNNSILIAKVEAEKAIEKLHAKRSNQGLVRYAGHVVANQLHYVCQQLRYETRGIVAHHNPVDFTPNTFDDTPSQIKSFLQDCPPIHMHQIRTLRVRPQKCRGMTSNHIRDLGSIYPGLNIQLYVFEAEETQLRNFAKLLTIRFMYRADEEYFVKYPGDKSMDKLWTAMRAGYVATRLAPSNVVFFLRDNGFSEAKFRSECWAGYFVKRIHDPLSVRYERMNEMVRMMKDWYAKGI